MQVPNSDDFMERVMEPKTRYRPPRNDQEGFLGLERFAISTTHSQFKMATPEEKKHMMEYQCKKIQETQQKLDLFIEPLVKIDRQIEEL